MAITRLQFVHTENAASAGTITQAITVSAGSLLVVICGETSGGAANPITDVRDDLSNVGAVAAQSVYNPNFSADIWYIKNVTVGARTVTVTYTSPVTARFIGVIELGGADTSTPLDVHSNHNSADSTNPTTPSVTPTVDGDYCVGVVVNTAAPTAVSPYADVYVVVATDNIGVEDQIQGTAAATNASWTAANGSWNAAFATFKAASGAVDRDVIVRYGNMGTTTGSGLVMAAFLAQATTAAPGGYYEWYYTNVVQDGV